MHPDSLIRIHQSPESPFSYGQAEPLVLLASPTVLTGKRPPHSPRPPPPAITTPVTGRPLASHVGNTAFPFYTVCWSINLTIREATPGRRAGQDILVASVGICRRIAVRAASIIAILLHQIRSNDFRQKIQRTFENVRGKPRSRESWGRRGVYGGTRRGRCERGCHE
jgi:hypothetical protein